MSVFKGIFGDGADAAMQEIAGHLLPKIREDLVSAIIPALQQALEQVLNAGEFHVEVRVWRTPNVQTPH
jgi:hypothetical protein